MKRLIELLERYGGSPDSDIRELWKRIVLSVLISNTDDHLRNHGFLLSPDGWRLSPVYDINPNPAGRGLSLNISEDDNSLDPELCLEVAGFFRWSAAEAKSYVERASSIVSSWPRYARELGIPAAEQVMMEPAFMSTH